MGRNSSGKTCFPTRLTTQRIDTDYESYPFVLFCLGLYSAIQAYTRQTPYEYCRNYEYIRGKLSRINTPTGYYENGRHYFYVKDYQGNVRCTVADNDSLTKAVHYYPGGSLFGESYGYYFWSGNNLFQGGKLEKSDAHTFYDLQNRHYDPILPHFISVDSKSESYYPFSFYNYALCNPIRYRDPDGNAARVMISGHDITISAVIYLHGPLANVELAQSFRQNIMDTWGQHKTYNHKGTNYDLNWDIKVLVKQPNTKEIDDGKTNYLDVTTDIQSAIYGVGGTHGKIRRFFKKEENPMAHEFGHILACMDHYIQLENGYIPEEGWEGNIMGESAGRGKVEYKNLYIILNTILNMYHDSNDQQIALKWGVFSFGQFDYIEYRNNTNKEE